MEIQGYIAIPAGSRNGPLDFRVCRRALVGRHMRRERFFIFASAFTNLSPPRSGSVFPFSGEVPVVARKWSTPIEPVLFLPNAAIPYPF